MDRPTNRVQSRVQSRIQNRVNLLHLDRALVRSLTEEELDRHISSAPSESILLEWDEEPRGLFARLRAGAAAGKQIFPGRWLAAPETTPSDAPSRLFWVARNDQALARLLGQDGPGLSRGLPRPDQPLCLLGMPGDVLEGKRGEERRRLAALWLQKLGADRVALVTPATEAYGPLEALASERARPLFGLASSEDLCTLEELGCPTLLAPNFLLDGEHRLPDEAFVPSARDLVARGSLLRERRLYERLPEAWRQQAELELTALQAWSMLPLLRRAASLIQTVMPLADAEIQAPLPGSGGVLSWLLGLGDQRPGLAELAPSRAAAQARELAAGLHAWDRQLRVELPVGQWNRLRHRLLPWADGGHLALCPERVEGAARRFCFSGQPLWMRAPLRGEADGLPQISLQPEDRRALGFFELELVSKNARSATAASGPMAPVQKLPISNHGDVEQLGLAFPASR